MSPLTFERLSQGERSEPWGSRDYSPGMELIDSEMAGPIRLKTWWDDRGHVGERPREEIFWIRPPGSGLWTTGASSRPWGLVRDSKLAM